MLVIPILRRLKPDNCSTCEASKGNMLSPNTKNKTIIKPSNQKPLLKYENNMVTHAFNPSTQGGGGQRQVVLCEFQVSQGYTDPVSKKKSKVKTEEDIWHWLLSSTCMHKHMYMYPLHTHVCTHSHVSTLFNWSFEWCWHKYRTTLIAVVLRKASGSTSPPVWVSF